MDMIVVVLLIILIALAGITLWKLSLPPVASPGAGDVGQKLDQLQGRFEGFTQIASDLHSRLGQLTQSHQTMMAATQKITDFQSKLIHPKFRGSVGEVSLEMILSQTLPRESYERQYKFRTGDLADALIRLVPPSTVAVDAKFPMPGFNRIAESKTDEERQAARRQFLSDVRKHVDDIARKYIRPEEETLDFAFMYIPAESVFYEVIVRDAAEPSEGGLDEYARRKRIIPVSPNSLHAYLQTVVMGLNGMKIEQTAREIMNHLNTLKNDFGRVGDAMGTITTHLKNLQGAYATLEKELSRFGSRLDSLR